MRASYLLNFADLDPAEVDVSLLTVGTGNNLYMVGGHSLLRVKEKNGIDVIVDWGRFDPDEPNFYFRYLLGQMQYSAGTEDTYIILQSYKYLENRSIYENHLNLSKKQKFKLFQIFDRWLLPENKNYNYHLLRNNCATIIREIYQKQLAMDLKSFITNLVMKILEILDAEDFLSILYFHF